MNYTCQKCNKSMDEDNFYTHKDGTKTNLCKKCLTMHIDNFDPNTFLWILEDMDVPYIPEEWNVLRDRAYTKDPKKVTGMSVFGKYLSKMKLKQWKQYGWADTDKIAAERAKREAEQLEEQAKIEAQLKDQLDNGEISEAQYKTLVSTETQYHMTQMPDYVAPPTPVIADPLEGLNIPNPADELTNEDKIYLAMKWGVDFTPNDWIDLERKYVEMKKSFPIDDSDSEGNLILICKVYVKMNQAINQNDMETFAKLSRTYETMRKSSKFTAAQNKAETKDYVTSVGQLIAICEKEGFIPRYATDIPQDKVDLTLKDMENYLYKLVTQDLGFGQQIEDSIKKIQLQKEMQAEEDENFLTDGPPKELEDDDFETYFEEIERQKEQDIEMELDQGGEDE